jgi:shikimate dehydrogenase
MPSASVEGGPHYAVIGDPVEHSLSPRIFGWLRARGVFDGAYGARRVPAEGLSSAVEAVRQGEYRGLSVTLPHKERLLGLVDSVDEKARAVGAANCLRHQGGRVEAFNTDAEGVSRALSHEGVSLEGRQVLVLGAGGAARAAVAEALFQGAAVVIVANRTLARAEVLARSLERSSSKRAKGPAASQTGEGSAGTGLTVRPVLGERSDAQGPTSSRAVALPFTPDALGTVCAKIDVAINATSVGLGSPDESPWPPGLALRPGAVAMDMVYRPLETAWLRQVRSQGVRTVDGLWMLVFQALAQLRVWTGYEADDALADSLHAHLCEVVAT